VSYLIVLLFSLLGTIFEQVDDDGLSGMERGEENLRVEEAQQASAGDLFSDKRESSSSLPPPPPPTT